MEKKKSNSMWFKTTVLIGITISIIIGLINSLLISSLYTQVNDNLETIGATYDQNTETISDQQSKIIDKLDEVVSAINNLR